MKSTWKKARKMLKDSIKVFIDCFYVLILCVVLNQVWKKLVGFHFSKLRMVYCKEIKKSPLALVQEGFFILLIGLIK